MIADKQSFMRKSPERQTTLDKYETKLYDPKLAKYKKKEKSSTRVDESGI